MRFEPVPPRAGTRFSGWRIVVLAALAIGLNVEGAMVQVLRRDTHVMVDEGENVELQVGEEGRVHVFDEASGDRLGGVQRVTDGGRATWEPFTTARRDEVTDPALRVTVGS